MKTLFLSLCISILPLAVSAQWKGKPADFTHGRLKVSDNKRFLIHADGTPFFWLGDTGWELFHKLNREEADKYLENRARKGFTVIQAVALAELDGVTTKNACGFMPLEDSDPSRPAVKDGPDNDYWDQVDYIINKANSLGIHIGVLPTWGRYWHDKDPIFNPDNAFKYGKFIGQRYKDKHIIWIMGGDRSIDNDRQREIVRAMARGVREGDGGNHLITFHPTGARGSAEWFHNDELFDFNMRQNGHSAEYVIYAKTLDDYNRTPAKPVIDGEPLYEDHPLSFQADRLGHSVAADARKAFYWDMFNGAFGHTYGHHSIWQMYMPDRGWPVNNPLMPWYEAIDQPGSIQMMYGRLLMESRPFLTRIPVPAAIVTDRVATSVPGAGRYRYTATGDEKGSYLMVYVPVGRKFSVKTNVIKGEKIKAWWFNPRNGTAKAFLTFKNDGKDRQFTPPDLGEDLDWVLVLDDAAAGYGAPGKSKLL